MNSYEDSIVQQAIALLHHSTNATSPTHTVFGLSANPPTLDHLAFIQHLISTGQTVIIIPNRQSTLKPGGIDGNIKKQMLQSMLDEYNVSPASYVLSDLEINRPAPSRMIVTLALLALKMRTKVTLSLGLDTLQSFTRWHRWDDFKYFCDLKFYPRPLTVEEEHHKEDYIQTMATQLYSVKTTGINVEFVYNTPEQQALCEHIIRVAFPLEETLPVGLTQENILTTSASSTAIRQHYSACRDQHPQISQSVHELILHYGLY
jgi:nicotinic acid mononucleotide adenylyltransferase